MLREGIEGKDTYWKYFICMLIKVPHNLVRWWILGHYIDKENEAHLSYTLCPKLYRQSVVELEIRPRFVNSIFVGPWREIQNHF